MSDDLLRIIAAVAAVAVLGAPYAGKVLEHARGLFAVREPQTPAGIGIDDMTQVLRLSQKLRLAGNTKGVALAQQLLDAMLTPEAKK